MNDARRAYFSWNPAEDSELSSLIVGDGHVGGKGRSLLFAMRALRDRGSEAVRISFPPSIFIGVEVFWDFLSSLKGFELRGMPFEAVQGLFLSRPLPKYAYKRLEAFLSDVNAPLVVRSSSLLEDSTERSFVGKYLTTFLTDGGSMTSRLWKLERAIKLVYASTFSQAAENYRSRHGLGDDAMGVVIMRMAGKWRGRYYYPTTAGVAYSRNYRRWSPRIKVEDGMVRLCFGLGTISTRRGYARTFSLTNPYLRPEGHDPFKIMRQAQERFQALDGMTKGIVTLDIKRMWRDLMRYHDDLGVLAQVYRPGSEGGYFDFLGSLLLDPPSPGTKPCFTFEDFPRRYRHFFERMKRLLSFLEEAMGMAAYVEFAYETEDDDLELLEARPLWENKPMGGKKIPDLSGKRVILKANRMVTDGFVEGCPCLVYVDYRSYAADKDYAGVVKALGELNKLLEGERYILVAPGRVGSSNPELGVPVQYHELTNCRCIVEVGLPKIGFMPELSYGTHFFADLEEENVLYMPVFEGEADNVFDQGWFEKAPHEATLHPTVRLYRGSFSVYMDGERNVGVVIDDLAG